MLFIYEVEFIDEHTGESMITRRDYDHEADWQEIWDDIVSTGDLQMVHSLLLVEEDEDED